MCRKLCQVSPTWNRRQTKAKPGWSCAARQGRDTVPPLFGITLHENNLCLWVKLNHFRHEVGRREVCSAYKTGRRLTDQLESRFSVAGISSLVSLNPGAAVVYAALVVGTE